MLVNSFGKRTVSAQSLRSDQGRVEVCAPCAAKSCCAQAVPSRRMLHPLPPDD